LRAPPVVFTAAPLRLGGDSLIFEKTLSFLNSVTRAVMVALILFMSMVLLLQIISRFVVFIPLSWSQELLQYLNMWLVFLGAAVAVKEGAHIKIELMVERFPEGFRKGFRILSSAISAALVSLIAHQSFVLVGKTLDKTTGSFPLPVAYFYMSLLAGCCLMVLNYISLIYAELRPPQGKGA
jgi:C4-dicarboxylate transporter DctQ subunit